MYARYKLVVRYGDQVVFEKRFPSLNQLVKVASFFVPTKDYYMSCIDDLTEIVFSHANVLGLCKEFYNDKVLF